MDQYSSNAAYTSNAVLDRVHCEPAHVRVNVHFAATCQHAALPLFAGDGLNAANRPEGHCDGLNWSSPKVKGGLTRTTISPAAYFIRSRQRESACR